MEKYDFCGYATRANLLCSDGRTIMKDAFKHNDGQVVPLVWNHCHNIPENILGHALLENRDDGVYTYGFFNDSEAGQAAKEAVIHKDITAMSIYANKLKQEGGKVIHGEIREVSLVLAPANPGASIDHVICHSEDTEEAGVFYTGENFELYHADSEDKKETEKGETKPMAEEAKKTETTEEEKTVKEVWDSMTEEQKNVAYAIIGQVLEDNEIEDDEEENKKGEETEMKHNVFENEKETNVLSHSDGAKIITRAKMSSVGSLQEAIRLHMEENNTLQHGIQDGEEGLDMLFPEFKNLNPGAPEIIRPDQSWVMSVINKIHKSPYSRIRTRQADARIAELKAKGYQKKGDKKELADNIKLIGRTFDPQTIYIREDIHRDDIVDITDFDYVNYVWSLMKDNMYETLALAALVGDSREDGDPDKINETHIRSVYNDDELYTIHRDVDVATVAKELQGTNANANFGQNFIYAEAIIQASVYAREQYKGSGKPDLYCTPHLVNVMLLARDLNGRRIYDSKADLAKALNVGEIFEVEQLEGKTRTDKEGNTKKLLGLFVNLADYQFGSTKGGEVTKFSDFDIDFNKHKYLMETRLSGALTKIQSAIALEEPVVGE